MLTNSILTTATAILPTIVLEDCEVDGLDQRNAEGELVPPNITELCIKIYDFVCKTAYLIGYMEKPQDAINDAPYRKKIPKHRKRMDAAFNLKKAYNYILKKSNPNDKIIMIVFNKSWDERVLKANYARRGVEVDWGKIVFVDMAEIAHHMGFPYGTTQSRFASAYHLSEPPPANLHTSHADTRLLALICRRVFKEAIKDIEKLNQAFRSSDPEKALADYLLACDPTLAPTSEFLTTIERIKGERKAQRMIEITVALDLETTGLEPEETSHHDKAVRPLQLAAQVVAPDGTFYKEDAFSSYINPGDSVEISLGATQVHGITRETITGKPNVREVWTQFLAHIHQSKALKQCMTVYRINHPEFTEDDQAIKYRINFLGYNLNRYDLEILKQELMHGENPFDLKQAINDEIIGTFDLLPLAQTFFSEMKEKPVDRKLVSLADFYHISTVGAHNACEDVNMMLQIFQRMCAGLNISSLANALSHIRKNPGLAAKEIIRKAQDFVTSQSLSSNEAIQQSIELYKIKVLRELEEKEESKEDKKGKRKNNQASSKNSKKPIILETTQEQLVGSYPYEEGKDDPFIVYR